MNLNNCFDSLQGSMRVLINAQHWCGWGRDISNGTKDCFTIHVSYMNHTHNLIDCQL